MNKMNIFSLMKKFSKKIVGSLEDLEEEESIQVNNKEETTEVDPFSFLFQDQFKKL